jgi:hypothetical protein
VGSVADYIEKFASLMDHLAAYESSTDPLHYTMKFIDGLCDDLKASVLIQRPSDLDTAYVLAQLQEEVSFPSRRREFKKTEFSSLAKQEYSSQRADKTPLMLSDERRGTDASKTKVAEDLWAALRASRRAQGLC